MSGNPLVDEHAHTNFQDYSPFQKNSDGSTSFNPVMEGPGGTDAQPGWLSGIPILGSAESVYHDIQNNDSVSEVLDAVSTGLEAFAVGTQVATDVLTLNVGGLVGNLIAAPLTAWILDHVKPIRLVMDELIGNPGTIAAVGTSWSNMSKALGEMTTDLQNAAKGTQQYWQGGAADAYRDGRANKLATGLGTASVLCEAWAIVVKVMGELVKVVHDAIRDLVAQLVAILVELAVNCMVEGPEAALVELGIEAGPDIVRVATIVERIVMMLAKAMKDSIVSITKLVSVASDLYKLVKGEVDAHS